MNAPSGRPTVGGAVQHAADIDQVGEGMFPELAAGEAMQSGFRAVARVHLKDDATASLARRRVARWVVSSKAERRFPPTADKAAQGCHVEALAFL